MQKQKLLVFRALCALLICAFGLTTCHKLKWHNINKSKPLSKSNSYKLMSNPSSSSFSSSSSSSSRFINGKRFGNLKNFHALDDDKLSQVYKQRLDHFNEAEKRVWNQRYWVNEEFFNGTGPVFIMIGGEGEENPIWMKNGAWIEYAKKYNALCVMLEHRFYGKSRPTDDMSDANMVYLSSEQGLADLASFRNFIREEYKLSDSTNKWISFGGSYPGSLSAWFRLKYPHLIHASVASSAPMFAEIDFQDYMVVVNASLSSYSPECTTNIARAHKQVQMLMETKGGRQSLQSTFRTCQPIEYESSKEVTQFYAALSGNFEGVVQYNKDNRAFEGAIDTAVTIDLLCDTMNDKNVTDPIRRYAAVNDIILDTYGQKCLDTSYSASIAELQATSWNSSASVGGRQWTYQTCIEFGYFQSTTSKRQPFGNTVPIEFYIDQCRDIFGEAFDLALLRMSVKDTNVNYGGIGYAGSRVVFVNGKTDPWHALGILPGNSILNSNQTEAILIDGTAHCADMYPSSDTDLPQLTAARQRVSQLIGEWLSI